MSKIISALAIATLLSLPASADHFTQSRYERERKLSHVGGLP
jgi:hypothetical protein